VTVHQLLDDGVVRELYKATGGAWGGTKVDEAFIEYFCEMFTHEVVDVLKRQYAPDWVQMMRDFETVKRTINVKNEGEFIRLMLRPSVQEVYQEIMDVNLSSAFQNNASKRGAILNRHRLQVPKTVIAEMIEQVAKSIKSHTSFLLNENEKEKLDFIMMVGGFSNSPIVIQAIKDLVGSSLPVIVPENAELSVVQGAVIFGWKPNAFKSRKSRKTYGISMVSNFRDGTDPEHLGFLDDEGRKKCRMLFDLLVQVNEEIEIDQVKTRYYFPVYNNQQEMSISLFASEQQVVGYCDDFGVEKLGPLTVPMPNTTGNKTRKVRVDVRFGDTEFTVIGVDETTGKNVNATYDFLD